MALSLTQNGLYYTVEVEIGSDNQPGTGKRAPDAYFIIDLETQGLYITDVDIKGFKGEGVFDPTDSDTYTELALLGTTAT